MKKDRIKSKTRIADGGALNCSWSSATNFSVSIAPSELKILQRYAIKRQLTLSSVIRAALRQYGALPPLEAASPAEQNAPGKMPQVTIVNNAVRNNQSGK